MIPGFLNLPALASFDPRKLRQTWCYNDFRDQYRDVVLGPPWGKRREPLEMRLESIRIHLLLRIPSSPLSLLPFLFIASLNGEMAAGVFLLSAPLCSALLGEYGSHTYSILPTDFYSRVGGMWMWMLL